MSVDETDRECSEWERGLRLRARGASWTLLDFETGADCSALHLAADDSPRTRTLLTPFDRCRRLSQSGTPRVVPVRAWIRGASAIAGSAQPAGGFEAAGRAGVHLLAYQLEPALAVLRHGVTRLLIADAVGLGKTIQAGLLISELTTQASSARTLVLVPAGLREQWAQELRRLFNLTAVLADAPWLRATARDRPVAASPWALPGVYLASQDFVKRPEVLRPLEEVTWDLVVIDEAHSCSSRSDRRTAANAIAERSRRVVLLTATPHADNPAEFAALCALGRVEPDEPDIVIFQRSRQEVSTALPRRSTLLAVRPSEAEMRMHDLLERYTAAVWRESRARGDDLARLAATVLRKRALSSAASLALSVRRRLALLIGEDAPAREQLRLPLEDEDPLEDVEPAAVLGAPGLAHAAMERRWLAAIAEAAHRASRTETKTEFLRRLLARVPEPAIVFTEFRDTLLRLSTALASTGRPVMMLHGGMTTGERSRIQRAFNQTNALLLATDAAAEGLNLHARCRVVVHYELPWSTTRLEQRAGRVDRFGQSRRVHELALVAASTAERLVLAPLIRRAGRARTMRGATGLAAALTESRVAETIIGGAPWAPDDVPPARESTRSLSIGAEAAEEVNRLTAIRALRPSRRMPGPPQVSFVARTRSALEPGIAIVFLISLTSAAGRRVHTVPGVLFLAMRRLPVVRTTPGALRTLAGLLASPGHPVVGPAIARIVRDAVDRASLVHQRVEDALERRDAAMRRLRSSAARRLVQPGLFERQTLPEATQSQRLASLAIEADERTAGPRHRVLAIDVRLAAVLHVRRR